MAGTFIGDGVDGGFLVGDPIEADPDLEAEADARVAESLARMARKDSMAGITVEFYEESKHPRDKNGRWAPAGGGPGAAVTPTVIRRETQAHGGMTMRRLTGDIPKTGFVVSEFPQHSLVLSLEDMKHETGRARLKSWLRSKAKLLDQPENFTGSWRDTDSGHVYVDVVRVFPKEQRAQAIEAGRKANQIAIWDLEAQAEIDTGGTGKAAAIVIAMAAEAAANKVPTRRGYLLNPTGDVDADADLLIGAILADAKADEDATKDTVTPE